MQSSEVENARWFLNGLMLDKSAHERLELSAGDFELIWIDAKGRSSAVKFMVK